MKRMLSRSLSFKRRRIACRTEDSPRLVGKGSLRRRLKRLLSPDRSIRSEEHTSELQSLMRISYAVFCLKKKKINNDKKRQNDNTRTNNTQVTQEYSHTTHAADSQQ